MEELDAIKAAASVRTATPPCISDATRMPIDAISGPLFAIAGTRISQADLEDRPATSGTGWPEGFQSLGNGALLIWTIR